MALDPLKFKIAVDKASLKSDLTTAKSDIESTLNPVKIRLKISNLDEIKKSLESIGADTSKGPAKKVDDASKELKKFEKEAEKAKTKLAEIKILLDKMDVAKTKAGGLGLDTTKLQEQIDALNRYKAIVKEIALGSKTTTDLSKEISGYGGTKKTATAELSAMNKEIKDAEKAHEKAAKEAERHARAMEKAAKEAMKLSEEERKLAQAIDKTVSEMNRQSQVLSDLKSMAMQYLSVYAGQQFLNNIIEIGGQLEMQRLSIGAILQDTAQAQDLFDRIKALALQSPFGVVELDQFTKQLSAYGFKYNELYDMTKRLADISAGAGTDVSRLALALGHVRAEGALTGYTLRQFAMNNIPMLGKLSEKLSELEGRRVTAGEVRKRVRNKDIDYAMVESVIKDLTNEGGMFYNMQEVISGSVKAKWKNLRDAFDVMYGEMAESSVGGRLKGVATTLTSLAKRWKEIGSVVMSVATVYGGMKAIMLVYNTLLGTQARAVFATVAAEKQAEISKLQLAASYRTLSAAERAALLSGKQLTVQQLMMAINTKKLTMEELARAVALGKVNKAMALTAIEESKLAAVQKGVWGTAIGSVRTYGMLTGVINGTAMAFSRLGMAMKALLMNPMTWIFAAVAAITDLWSRNNQEIERAKELSKGLAERSSEGIKNAQAMMKETGMTRTDAISGGKIMSVLDWTDPSQMDGDAMIQTMEKWEEFIKNYSSMANTYLQNALFDDGKLRDITDQYGLLAQAVHRVIMEQERLGEIAESTDFVLESTSTGMLWGAFNDDLVKNMDDYAKSIKATDSAISKFAMNHKHAMSSVLFAAKADETFAEAVKKANEEMQEKEHRNLTEEEQLRKLVTATNEAGEAMYENAVKKAMYNFHWSYGDKAEKSFMDVLSAGVSEQMGEQEMLGDMEQAAAAIRQKVKENWHKDISELEDFEKAALLRMVTDIAAKSGESTETIRDKVIHLFADILEIPVDLDDVDAYTRISQLQEELNKLVAGPNGEGYPIEMKAVADANDFVQKVREAYKKAKDTITNLGPIVIKMGLSLDQVKVMTPEEIDKASGGSIIRKMALTSINEAYKAIAASETTSNEYGFSLLDSTTSGKVFKTPKPKKTKTKTESKEDKQAKAWRERIKQLKDARSWFEKWEKEVGETSALRKVKEQFKGLIDPKDIRTLEAMRDALNAVKAAASVRKDEKAQDIVRQIDDELANIDYGIFQREGEKFTSGMKREIDDLTRRWDIYNSVLDSTGDRLVAMRLAGFTQNDTLFGTRSAAESLRNTIDQSLILPNFVEAVDYNAVSRMSDKDIENYVKNMFSQYPKYQNMIDGIVDGLKEWRKLQQEVVKGDITSYAQLIGSAKDYGTQIRKNNAYVENEARRLNDLHELGKISNDERAKALRMLEADRDWKNYQTTAIYRAMLNRSGALTQGDVDDTVEEILRILKEMYESGAMDEEQYFSESERARKMRDDWNRNAMFGRSNALTSFLSGGTEGLRKFLIGKRDLYEASGEEDEMKQMQKYIDLLDKVGDTLNDFDIILKIVTGALEGLQRAATAMANMFDALGKTGKANTWSDIADGIGAISSVFSPVSGVVQSAMSGDVGGLLSNVIAAPFEMIASPITGFAQLHDKKRERQLEDLKDYVHKIDNTLNLIRTSRNRSLGYDDGSYRRMMALMYAGKGGNKAMYEYYTRGGTEGTGYEQELNGLMAQREAYLEMYDKEKDKKKESKEALEEYKQKIAELDDQIKNYTEDLAKDLWSIDIKGWADQIGDALMTAFENGTNALTAYESAVQNIMRSVVSEMLKVGILEPMMANLRERLFGANGAFDINNPSGSMGNVLSVLGEFFGSGGEGQQMMIATQEFLDGANNILEQLGIVGGLKTTGTTGTVNGIQSQATEESIGIVSGQLAALRQDVSVNRIFLTQVATEQVPRLLESAKMQQTLLESQFQSVLSIERMMREGDGALYSSIDKMSTKIDRAITPEGRMRIE